MDCKMAKLPSRFCMVSRRLQTNHTSVNGSSSNHSAASLNFRRGRHEYLHPYLSLINAKSLWCAVLR